MYSQFIQFIVDRFNDIPASVYWVLLLVFCLGTVLLLAFFGVKNGITWSARLLLLEYLFFLLSLTVLFRPVQAERIYDFTPFWSYRALLGGKNSMLIQMALNIIVFIPVGILFGCAFSRLKWWQVLLICGGFSVLIEALQFVLKRGVSEFDDVFHNVLGCAIGYGVYLVVAWVVNPRERLSKTKD